MKREIREFTFENWPRTINDMREALGYDKLGENMLSARTNRWIQMYPPRDGARAWVIINKDTLMYLTNLTGFVSLGAFPEDAVLFELRMIGYSPEPMGFSEIVGNEKKISGKMTLAWLRDLEKSLREMRRELAELREVVYNLDINRLMILPSVESRSEREDACFANDAVFERKDAPEQEDK